MSHVFHRNSRAEPPTVSRGEGAYLYDTSGKAYLDGSGGAAVSCLGHGDPHVTAAIKAQLDKVAFAHTGFLSSEPAEALADRLVAVAPKGLERVYFVSGGSEAMEAALKLVRQYFIEAGQPQRSRVIARRQSYHGNTLGALATGGNAWRRAPFAPLLMEVSHVSPCYAYRGMQEGETAQGYVARLVAELEAEIKEYGSETIMAFVAEPVVGATLGAVPPVDGYYRAVREVCDRHGILLILDEVMCGMGRTGTLFACEQDGIAPDICAIAKGLGAGYQPIGAMMCTAKIHDTIAEGSGFFQHGHTYLGHPTACAAAGAVLDRLLNDGVAARVAPLGDALRERLVDRFGQYPHVGDVRGRGLFQGIELVEDRETKAPFDPGRKLHAKIKAAAFEAGLICYPMGGTVDGQRGDHVLLAPPFILTESQLDELVDKLGQAVETVLA
ncbi:Adenosylmethionine-8-amino-7-oxononanoate aminotransferase [Roseovarius sp. THAF9]|uniref:aspartate aminotransferase family protein n=1 Tax=Roseovarius sp. THAF9 TaxID=2587847 RepID=UPI0012678B17|nr:aspartate aminotransferase family protein [Roseovarius sp. THAF9]QFT94477.1 Adenosylmethionine-8-amino-7-oxononanoate aminotransferase [Roseovarius sp. THAF9]